MNGKTFLKVMTVAIPAIGSAIGAVFQFALLDKEVEDNMDDSLNRKFAEQNMKIKNHQEDIDLLKEKAWKNEKKERDEEES